MLRTRAALKTDPEEAIKLSAQATTPLSATTMPYETWVQSNVGIIAGEHQEILRDARILVAGTGAEGSSASVCLTRLGVGHLRIADIDDFEAKNLNRQFGCYRDTLGTPKVNAVGSEIRRINPDIDLDIITDGVTVENAETLVEDVSCVLMGIDMYRPEAAFALDRAARKAGLFMVSGITMGFRNDVYVFSPDGMGLLEYCSKALGEGHYPYVPIPPPAGFPEDLAVAMKELTEGLPDLSSEEFAPAFRARLATADPAALAIPAIAPSVFLGGARMAIEVYGILTGAREPVLAPGYTSVDLFNVVAEKVLAG